MSESGKTNQNGHSLGETKIGESGSELNSLLAILSESRILIAGIAIAVVALGALYAFIKTPVYEANAIVQVMQKSGGLSGLEQLSSLVQGTAVPTDTEIQLLQSRAVLMPVIDKLHMNISVKRKKLPIIGWFEDGDKKPGAAVSEFNVPFAWEGRPFTLKVEKAGAYRLYDPDGRLLLHGQAGGEAAARVDAQNGKGFVNLLVKSISAEPGTEIEVTKLPEDSAVSALQQRLTIGEMGKQTGIISIALRSESPVHAARLLNLIAEENVKQNIKINSKEAADQYQFLKKQLPHIRQNLNAAQGRLADYLSKHRILDMSQQSQYFLNLSSNLEQQIGQLELQETQANSLLGPKNIQLKALQKQLGALKQQRDKLMRKITSLPKSEQTLLGYQNDVQVAQSLYSAVLQQMQSLKLVQAGTVGDVRVVDKAIVPFRPTSPKKDLDIALSLLAGLILGVLAAFGRRALRQGLEDPEILEEKLGIPVHAMLAHSRTQKRLEKTPTLTERGVARLLAAHDVGDDLALEGLRSLRSSLKLTFPQGGQIICIASLGPGEGKSFVASNLAYLLAQSGNRVLLVDADLRRGHLHKAFGWERGRGFSEYLSGEAKGDEVVQNTLLEGLDVVTTGRLPDDASLLMVDGEIDKKIKSLSSGYDFIIFDIPPILAVEDSLALSRLSNANILLLKHGRHSLRQVRMAIRRYARHGVQFDGSILNDVTASAGRYAYREYGYHYQYKYKR